MVKTGSVSILLDITAFIVVTKDLVSTAKNTVDMSPLKYCQPSPFVNRAASTSSKTAMSKSVRSYSLGVTP